MLDEEWEVYMDNKLEVVSEEVLQLFRNIAKQISDIADKSYNQTQNDYRSSISVSERLGRNGWTVHGSVTPNDPREWIREIESNGEKAITEYYNEDIIKDIFDEMRKHYHTESELLYVEKAIENYEAERYTEAAFFLLALMDYRIKTITPNDCRRLTQRCKVGLTKTGEANHDSLSERPLARLFLLISYIPSFTAFATRIFVDGKEHDLDTGTEPEYLNRNWLMHGQVTRSVQYYECVQIINAFHTLMTIEEIINDSDA